MEMEKAVDVLLNARDAVAFTGAGASQESGIPTFRDPGGIWDRFDPAEIGTGEGIMRTFSTRPYILVEFLRDLAHTLEKAGPNAGHRALAFLEDAGFLKSVITQNVDNLHQEAGSKNVIELHGNFYELKCTSCFYIEKWEKRRAISLIKKIVDAFSAGARPDKLIELVPHCPKCGSLMRPNVVLFGEPVLRLQESFEEAKTADVFIVIGTSGYVYPAAYLPRVAKENGARIIEINPNGPFFSDVVDIFIRDTSARSLGQIMAEMKKRIEV